MAAARTASLKAALLGLSHPHTSPHLATLQNLPEVGEIVVWDPGYDPARHDHLLSDRRKVVECTDDLGALLRAGDIDFAILCVPTDIAAEVACQVVTAGVHLMAEKPVGLDPAEIRRVMRAAQRGGAVTSVLYGNRFNPAIQEARQLVRAGAIGRMLTTEVRLLTTQVRFRNPQGWLFQRRRAGGGILIWLGCHYLDLLHYVSGDPIVSVFARLATRSGEKIDVEDIAALSLRFASGAIGTFHAGYALAFAGGGYVNPGGYDNYLACNGQLGRVVWPDRMCLHIETPVKRGSPIRDKTYTARNTTSYGGSLGEAFMRQFIAAFQKGEDVPAKIEDALRVAEILVAVEKSAKSGREVKVKQVA